MARLRRRLVAPAEKPNRFWQLDAEREETGESGTITSGRLGTPGKSVSLEPPVDQNARPEIVKKLRASFVGIEPSPSREAGFLKLMLEIEKPKYPAVLLDIDASGRLVAIQRDRSVDFFNLDSGTHPFTADFGANEHVVIFALRFSPDGARLFVGVDSSCQVFDFRSRSARELCRSSDSRGTYVDVDASGAVLFVRFGSELSFYDAKSLLPLGSARLRFEEYLRSALSPSGKLAAVLVPSERAIEIYTVPSGAFRSRIELPPDAEPSSTGNLCFHPSDQLIVAPSILMKSQGDHVDLCWNVATGELHPSPLFGNAIYWPHNAVEFSPDGKLYATAGSGGLVSVSELETGRILLAYTEHYSRCHTVRFARDGSLLASFDGKRAQVRYLPTELLGEPFDQRELFFF